MATEIGRKEVVDAVTRAGIKDAEEVIPYIGDPKSEWRAKARAAVVAGDLYALANYCAAAVTAKLEEVGFTMPLDARALRAISEARDGWALLTDVVGGRENAAQTLAKRLQAFRALVGQGSQPDATSQRTEPGPRNEAPTRAQQNRAYERPMPPPRRHDAANVRQIGDARRAQQQSQPSPAQEQDQNTVETQWDSVKVHGGKAALTIEATTSRRNVPTVNIEAARLKDREARTYDWSNKIILQLTPAELQQVTLLLCGKISHVKFQNHGVENDKWFEIERQTGQYAGTIKFAVGQGRDVCLVQLTPADLGNVVGLFIRQCSRQMRVDQAALNLALAPVAQALNEQMQARGGGGARRHAS
ncbi:hypothetical protein [Luteimonas sp. MHLX1A]|uniref:hypothetical protein n=1 Tax=Alterluteimonas muca TaxID=2878684 RepID=UPI001E388225|nr:hypothetical protein [Luteimonas sp. MHLX1A]MCD9046912.1 hypothetical protein [Luteimonas sp. MHLX1A]